MFLAGAIIDPTGVLVQYGILGIVALVLGPFAYRQFKRERDRSDRLEAELRDANAGRLSDAQKVADQFKEVLVQTRDALTAANDYLRDLAQRRRS